MVNERRQEQSFSEKDFPDLREADELNETYEESLDEPSGGKHNSRIARKLVAFLLVVVFAAVFSFGGLGQLLPYFTLDFLQQSEELNKGAQVQQLKQAVVRVQVPVHDRSQVIQRQRSGTGFNISSNGLIVTNYHVVKGASAIDISFANGSTFRSRRWKEYPNVDLALVYLDGQNLPKLSVNRSLPDQGQEVLVIGNPLGFPWVTMKGKVTGMSYSSLSTPVLQLNAPIQSGNSGSPVINEQGQAVAVIYAVININGQLTGLAVPIANLPENISSVLN